MKRILAFLIALSVLSALSLTAFAHDVPVDISDCSIEVIVRYDGKNITGGTLTAIKVGYVDENDGNFFFRQELTDVRLEDLGTSGAPAVQEKFYKDNKSSYSFSTQTQSVKDGKATFTDLSTGLYLITQSTAAKGYSKMDPFLVTVPYLEDGKYQYDVTALIKSELEREPEPTKAPPSSSSGSKLPQTGQLNWPVPFMAVTGLVVFTVGWVLYFGKKRE